MSTRSEARIVARGEVASPLGEIRLAASAEGLVSAAFSQWRASDGGGPGEAPGDLQERDAAHPAIRAARRALEEYFEGEGAVSRMPALDLRGTDLQRAVWAALTEIPAGVTRTYSDVAEAVGRPSAVRAVAAAIGANPVGVLVPCHRVIGRDGSLTGYAGGLDRKRWLLAHEGAALDF